MQISFSSKLTFRRLPCHRQFDRAVEIVQSSVGSCYTSTDEHLSHVSYYAATARLPKTGPIQTGYEEKLALYRYVAAGAS